MNELSSVLTDTIEVTIKDKTVKLKKITLGILADFGQKIFERKLSSVISASKEYLTPKELAALINEYANNRSAELETQAVGTIDGMKLLLELSAKAAGASDDDIAAIANLTISDIPVVESIINLISDSDAQELVEQPPQE